jgi:predicted TPR repeat methyltransferase
VRRRYGTRPSDYVEKLFDDYAHKFDSHLLEVLSYSVPEKLADLLRPHADAGGEKWSILDLGCGTGLSGAAVAAHARRLVVSISQRRCSKGPGRNLYHRLNNWTCDDDAGRNASTYGIVIATDVFVYLGKLDELMDQARRLLRPRGFAFRRVA